ncbi:type IX secretion/gliding motility protein PorT/SprT [Candidatus Venteria ishoeyi]|nr:porin family protein [Candidatus Venteria ishoeyi]
MLKKVVLSLVLISICFLADAQRSKVLNTPKYDLDPLHFGFTVGFNTMDFNIYNSKKFINSFDSVYAVNNLRQAGFNLGIVSNLRLAPFLDLRFLPGITFGQRDLEFLVRGKNGFYKRVMKVESTFLEFPLTLKYKAKRINNYRPYLIGGVNYRLDLAARKEIKEEEKPMILLERDDLYYELGFGIDYYLPFFKFSTEIKYCVGLANIIRNDGTEYSRGIEKMVSNLIVVSFHFE